MIPNKKIKSIRIAKGLTQEQVAASLGLSRTSWVAVEQGNRELSVAELRKFADLGGVRLAELIDLDEEVDYRSASEKYKQMLLAFLKFGSSDGRVPKTKLAKMLYLADFAWYRQHGSPMSGFQYKKLQYGPVADEYFRVLDEMKENDKVSVAHVGPAQLICANQLTDRPAHLTAEEVTLLKKIAARWKDRSTEEIVAFTHEQAPWKNTPDGYRIPYGLIEQEDEVY